MGFTSVLSSRIPIRATVKLNVLNSITQSVILKSDIKVIGGIVFILDFLTMKYLGSNYPVGSAMSSRWILFVKAIIIQWDEQIKVIDISQPYYL